jgi:hypothetical protein
MERTGYGRGQGMGYKNLVTQDPYIHSLSAKGVKTKKPKKSKTPNLDMMKERKDMFSVLQGKGFRKDFGMIATPQKRGLIRELARKVAEGIEWAKEWEKHHLPSQKAWVKKEFEKAKEEAIKLEKAGAEKLKEWKEDIREKKAERELKKEGFEPYELQKAQDLNDVRDELDIDNNGTQDISMSELNKANQDILSGLETIDLDNNGVPDHQDDEFTNLSTINLPIQPSYTEPSVEVMTNKPMTLPIPTMTGEPPEEPIIEPLQVEDGRTKMGVPFPMMTGKDLEPKKDTFLQKTTKFVRKEFELGKGFVKKKQKETRELHQTSDAQLRQLAIQEGASMFGLNRYEREIIRREKEKKFLAEKIKAVETGQETGVNLFGFLNPVATLSKPQTQQKTSGEPLIPDALSFVNPLATFKPSTRYVSKEQRYYDKKLKPKVQRLNDGFEPFGFLNPIAELKTLRR